MFNLINTHSNTTISNHRTLEAAVKAEARFHRAMKRVGGGAYGRTTILCDGERLTESQASEMFEIIARL